MANVQLQDLVNGTPIYPITNLEGVTGLQTELDKKLEATDLEDLEGQVAGHQTALENIETNYATSADLESGLADLKSEILGDDLEETFDTLKAVQDWADKHGTEYAELVQGVQANAGAIGILQGKVTTAEGDITNLKTDLATAQGDITDLDGRVEELEGAKDEFNGKFTEIDAALATKADDADLTALENKVDGVQSDLGTLGTKVTGIDDRLITLEGTVEGIETALEDMASAAELAELQTKVTGVQTDLGTLDTKVEGYQSSQVEIKSELDALTTTVEGNQASLVSVKGDVETLKSTKLDASEYESDKEELDEIIKGLQTRIETLENKEYSNVKWVDAQ